MSTSLSASDNVVNTAAAQSPVVGMHKRNPTLATVGLVLRWQRFKVLGALNPQFRWVRTATGSSLSLVARAKRLYWTRKRVPKRYQRCCCCCCSFLLLFLCFFLGSAGSSYGRTRNMYEKSTKFPNFTRFFSRKMPEFYIIIARKICAPAPVSYAYAYGRRV